MYLVGVNGGRFVVGRGAVALDAPPVRAGVPLVPALSPGDSAAVSLGRRIATFQRGKKRAVTVSDRPKREPVSLGGTRQTDARCNYRCSSAGSRERLGMYLVGVKGGRFVVGRGAVALDAAPARWPLPSEIPEPKIARIVLLGNVAQSLFLFCDISVNRIRDPLEDDQTRVDK
jgi:hypothetical protein